MPSAREIERSELIGSGGCVTPAGFESKPTYEELERHVIDLEEQVLEGKRAQLQLEESKGHLNAVLDTIQAGIVLIDAETRIIVGVNNAAAKMIGAPVQKIINKRCHCFICPADQGRCPVLDFGKDLDNTEQELLTVSGECIPILKTSVSTVFVGRKHVLESFVDIRELKKAEEDRESLIVELQDALAKVKTLSGLLPICASCKKIRDDKGYWNQMEAYIRDHSEAEFSHSICPGCSKELYPELNRNK